MRQSAKTQALQDLIVPAVRACNVALWGIEFVPQGRKSLLRIYIDALPTDLSGPAETQADTPSDEGQTAGLGIGVADCVRVTHQVNGVLDVHDPISGEYLLEVSSPGWDRIFFTLEQMTDYIGQTVALRLISPVDNRRKLTGVLQAVELSAQPQKITVLVDEKSLEIVADNIDKANLVYAD